MTDARRARRRRVLKGARIDMGEGLGTIPCTVKDLSESGCRLQLERVVALPNEFRLLIELDGIEFVCEQVWRKSGVIGVAFKGQSRNVRPMRTQVLTRNSKG